MNVVNLSKNIILFLFLILIPNFSHAVTVDISATVEGCDDGLITGAEQCDGSNLGGASCTSLGFNSGTLSCSSACTFNTDLCVLGGGSSGGGGGGGGGGSEKPSQNVPDTNVVFSGRAYPLSRVSILKDGQLVVTTIAGPDSNFTATISGLSSGNYNFSVYSEDKKGLRSSPFTFPIYITSGVTTKIGGIFIAPTISVDKSEVRKGDNIAIFGQSVPSSTITINVNSEPEFFLQQVSDQDGVYLLNFNSAVLAYGKHTTRSKAAVSNEITEFSKVVNFLVGDKNVLFERKDNCPIKADLNQDCRVNLVDFSIAAFWYKKTPDSVFSQKERDYLNNDGKVDLVDFSIMAFHWTG